ncbi:MAG: RNA-dependent RNA polymerase [Guiyang argiope bruennichi polycipivirus 2]|nr:MAG: RNA-dependent RNA polymerase [Guiyang argiope bruennichi polycipivirus 2]
MVTMYTINMDAFNFENDFIPYSFKFQQNRDSLLDYFDHRPENLHFVLDSFLSKHLDRLKNLPINAYFSSTPVKQKFLSTGFDPNEANYLIYQYYKQFPTIVFQSETVKLILVVVEDDQFAYDSVHPVLAFLDLVFHPTMLCNLPYSPYMEEFAIMQITPIVADVILMLLNKNSNIHDENFSKGYSLYEKDLTVIQNYLQIEPQVVYEKKWKDYILCDTFESDPDIADILLMMANSDILNPGPVFSLPKHFGRELPDHSCLVTLPNTRSFLFQQDEFKFAENLEITTSSPDFENEIKGVFKMRSAKKGDAQVEFNKIRDMGYSNHVNFDIEKRVPLKYSTAFIDGFGGQIPEESEGVFCRINNFAFVPKNLIRFVFRRQHFTYKSNVLIMASNLLSSVEKQEMTLDQIALTAMRLSQIQLLTIDVAHDFDEYISVFADLISINVDTIIQGRKIQASFSDVWNFLLNKDLVVIPTKSVYYGSVHELFVYREPMLNIKSIPDVDGIISLKPTLLKYDFEDKTFAQLMSDFLSGKMRTCRSKNVLMKFDFSTEKVPFVLRAKNDDLNEYESFFERFIKQRFINSDLNVCFVNAVADVTSLSVARFLFRVFSEKHFSVRIGANLVKMVIRDGEKPVIEGIDSFLDHDVMRNPDILLEKQIAQRAQLEFQIFTSEFGCYSKKNVFNNVETVKYLYHLRRATPMDSTNYVKDLYANVKSCITEARNGFSEIVRAKGTLKEVNDAWEKNRESITKLMCLSETNSQFMESMDFSTFSSSIESAKMMLNGVFSAMIKKFTSAVGIEMEPTIDLTTALFYYIIWINTDNSFVRYMLVLDICAKLGIVDIVIASIRKIWNKISSHANSKGKAGPSTSKEDEDHTTPPNIQRSSLASVFRLLEERVDWLNSQTSKDLQDQEEEKFDIEKPTADFVTTLISYLEKGTPYILGISAVSLLASFGLPTKGMKCKIIGDDIVTTCRNLSFIAAGVAAVPKIYTHVSAVVYWVFDHLKKMIYKDHKTAYEFNEAVVMWCKSASIFNSASGYLIVKSPEMCLRYLELHSEMTKLSPKIFDMKRPLAIAFNETRRKFEQLYELVRGTMATLFPLQEIFHVMITGVPGVGKTDLADEVIKRIKTAYTQQEIANAITVPNDKCRGAILDSIIKTSAFGDVYNLSDSAKYMDNYFGQKLLRVDEIDAFGNLEPDSYIRRLMMLSGAPLGSDQAALENKGRMITSKMMVSNTNNPYLRPDHMKDPKALHRRRLLIRARFCPELEKLINEKKNTDLNVVIDDFCKLHKLNRTNSDHLLIDIMDNFENRVLTMGGVSLSGLTIPDAMRYISVQCKLHYAREWNRAVTKDSTKALLSMYFGAQMNLSEIEQLSSLNLPSLSVDLRNKLTDYATTYEEEVKSQVFSDQNLLTYPSLEKHKHEILSQIKREASFRSKLINYTIGNPLDPQSVTQALSSLKGSNANGECLTTEHSLEYDDRIDGYFVVSSEHSVAYSTGPIDFSKIVKCTTPGGEDYFVYKGDIDNEMYRQAVFGELVYLRSIPIFAAQARIDSKLKKGSQLGYIEKWKIETKNALGNLIHISRTVMTSVMNKIKKYVGAPILNGICVAIGLFGAIFAISATASLFVPSDALAYSSKRKEHRIVVPGISNAAKDVNLITKFSKNVVRVYNPSNNSYFTAFGYRGNLYLTNTHNISGIDKNITIYVANSNNTLPPKKMPFGPSCIKLIDGDVSLILLMDTHTVADLSRHWATEYDIQNNLENLRLSKAAPILLRDKRIVLDPRDNVERNIIVPNLQTIQEPSVLISSGLHPKHKTRMLETIIEHGDSGSPVFHDNPCLSGALFGLIHRKFDPYCLLAVVSREEIEKVAAQFDAKYSIKVQMAETPLVMDEPINAVFKYNQTVKESPYPNQAISTQSGFRKTPLFSNFPVESFPAIQHEADERIPIGARHHMEVSLNKGSGFTYPCITFEQEKFAKQFLESVYFKYHPEVLNTVTYTTVQAITGLPIPGSTSMEKSSCAGIPYKFTAKRGKDPFIRTGPSGETLIANSVFIDVENYENHYIYNEVPYNTKLEFRKMELVGIDKITNPKTRTVGMGNMIHWICYNKLWKDLFTIVKMVWNNGGTSPFALGMDVERHWNQVAKHLKYTDYVIEFDVKAWDANISLRTLFMASEVKLNILKKAHTAQGKQYNPNFDKIAYGLCVDFAVTDVCYEKILYEKSAGLLSGHPGTFMENSEIHEMILAIACKIILDKEAPQYSNATFLHEHVKSIKAADDILIAVSPLARKYITAEKLKSAYGEIGLQVTSATKSEVIEARPLTQVQFLKTGFKEIDGIYFPLPNTSIIHQLLNYVRTDSKLTLQEQLSTNFGNAMRFAFWRGPDEYEYYREKVNLLCAKNKIQFYWDFDYKYMASWIKHQAMLRAHQELRTEPLEESEYYQENLEHGFFSVNSL